MRGYKTFFVINVYITEDRYGEWWEWLKKDGSLRRFKPGTSEFNPDMEFKTGEAAKDHAIKKGIARFKILKNEPPIAPKTTWPQSVFYDSHPKTEEKQEQPETLVPPVKRRKRK